jgi:hypothetical protein
LIGVVFRRIDFSCNGGMHVIGVIILFAKIGGARVVRPCSGYLNGVLGDWPW